MIDDNLGLFQALSRGLGIGDDHVTYQVMHFNLISDISTWIILGTSKELFLHQSKSHPGVVTAIMTIIFVHLFFESFVS